MLVNTWLGALKTIIYVWGLVEKRQKKKLERHYSSPLAPKSETAVTVDEKNKRG